jgi:putative ABC transport system permease protein
VPGVAQVDTRIVVNVNLDVPGLHEPATGRLISLPEQRSPRLNHIYLKRGRELTSDRRHEVLISAAFAEANALAPGDSLGAVINGRWERLSIVGIALSPEYVYAIADATALVPDNRRFGVLWMQRKALATAFQMDGAFNDLALTLTPDAQEALVKAQVDRLLAPYGGLGTYDRSGQVSHRILSDELAQQRANATIIPTIFLSVAAFLLHVVLSRLVQTQREHIALLKALGYSHWTIAGHYFKYALLVALLGALLGTLLGFWLGSALASVYQQFFSFPFLRYRVDPSLMAMAALMSAGAAMFGAMSAVRRSLMLPPSEGLWPEPPPQYRPTWLERLGWYRWVSPVGRMVWRNMERKCWQIGSSILGIALAIAILVVGFTNLSAVAYLIDLQFRRAQREDATVLLNDIRSIQVRYDFAALPGVRRVEPFRLVPVELQFGHRSRRVSLTGLESQGTLRRLIDRDLKLRLLPPEGLVLTTELARILGVKPGDVVLLQVLNGERLQRQVRVSAWVDELLGLSAYMELRALARLLRQGPTLSGVYLSIDSTLALPLYTKLKQLPAVASVSFRRAALEGFRDTIAKSFLVFTLVLVIFASVIAFAVIYNAARIALSERGRELASLRIMGFTREEVAVVLLGEQAVMTMLALPVGCGLGWLFSRRLEQVLATEMLRIAMPTSMQPYILRRFPAKKFPILWVCLPSRGVVAPVT